MPSLTELTGPVDSDPKEPAIGSEPLGNRQIAAVLFVVVVLVAVISTLAYLVGRLTPPDGSRQVHAKTAEQIIVVDPVTATPPQPARARATTPVALPPAASPGKEVAPAGQPAGAASVPGTASKVAPTADSLAGLVFYQVAAVDKGMADVSVEYLVRKGIAARLGDSPSPGTYRVLAGPLPDGQENDRLRATLEALGFRPFLRRY